MMKTILRSICFLSCLWVFNPAFSQCPDLIKLRRQSQVDSFFIYYPNCQVLKSLSILGDSILYLDSLLGLKKVNVTLDISNCTRLKNLKGLDSLVYAKTFNILGLDSISNLNGLESLTEVNESFYIGNNDLLQNLLGLNALRIADGINVANNDNLISLEGLDPLSQGHPYALHVSGNDKLQSLIGLENTTQLWGIHISRNPALINLDELEKLKGLLWLTIDENINLVDLEGLKNLEVYDVFQPTIRIVDNPKLESLEGLEKMTSVYSLEISRNDLLTDLKGLENLREISVLHYYSLVIEGNKSLQSLHALDSLGPVLSPMHIRDNPLITDCDIFSICEFVQFSIDPTDIMNNGVGCNSIPEVITSCNFDYGYATGSLYLDMDCDDTFNTGDYILPKYIVENAENNFPVAATTDQGIFTRYLNKNDTLEVQPRKLKHFTNHPSSRQIISDSTYLIIDSVDFRLCPDTLFHDLAVSMVGTYLRPGFEFAYYVCIQNLGTYIEDAIVTFDFSTTATDQFITMTSAEQGGVISGTTVTWNFNDLFLYTSRCFEVVGELNPNTPIGALLQPHVVISSPSGVTEDLSNNEVLLLERVVGSYDPNDKTVDLDQIEFRGYESPLEYTIRFQNTGNYPATFIEIIDTLEDGLNMRSFEMIAASHPYTLSFPDTNIILWRFDNINLPDSLSNELESHGFVKFRINARAFLPANTTISNKAAIYFDFNEPVITNSASTVVKLQSKTIDPVELIENVSIYPNPGSGLLHLQFELKEIVNGNIEIFNTQGNTVFSKNIKNLREGNHSIPLDLSSISDGIYFLRLLTNDGLITKKVIIAK